MNLCRLCGEEKSPLDFNVELNDKTNSSWTYRELIEHHTRVSLKSNKLLPQSVCEECRTYIDGFAEFSSKVHVVQNTFDFEDEEFDSSIAKECLQLQPIVELFPETVIKEQQDSDEDSDDNDSSGSEEESHDQANDHTKTKQKYFRRDDSLTYEEVFKTKLDENDTAQFILHLDVSESAKLSDGELSGSSLELINPTRWSDMVQNCEACDTPFNNLIEFNAHQESIHNTKTAQIYCTLCTNSFRKIYSYINHVTNKHLQLEHLRYCCLICNKMFYSLVPLYYHVKENHSINLRRIFQCLVCGHHSENLVILKKHMKIHASDEKDEEEVDKIYADVKDTGKKLTLAVEECHRNDDGTVSCKRPDDFKKWSDFPINCSMCTKRNLTPIEYFMHHINDHMDWTKTGKDTIAFRFNCNECPEEVFASLTSFCSHLMYKHSHDELSFRCLVCSKLFWNYAAHSHHVKFFHPSFRFFICKICGKMTDRFCNYLQHLNSIHGTGDTTKKSPMKNRKLVGKRRTKSIETAPRTKRAKAEKIFVKEESDSDSESDESESELDDEASSEDVPLQEVSKDKRKKKSCGRRVVELLPKRRPNNRHRTEKQILYGPELDTPEKLFAEEINGTSIFPSSVYLNISVQVKPPNGEVSDELATSQGVNPLRWRDMLVCAVCKLKFININGLTNHIADNHGTRTRAFGCYNCDIDYGALYESSLVNHLVERHYYEHLKLCCLVCSKMFYDFLSLVNHYKTHDGHFQILVCFICGFYAKTIDDLKEHKAYHVQMENSKPDNQTLCERVLEKFNQGAEPNMINTEVAEYERNPDGTVTMECQRRFTVDWSFAVYQCPLCFADYSNPFELFSHLRLKHPKEQDQTRRVYSCKTCVDKKLFSGMHYFINHAAELHVQSLRFTCVVCSRLFWNYLALANHYKNVHPTFTAVLCCHCGKLFHSITSGAIHYKKIMIMLTDEEKKLKKEGKLQEPEESTHICHVCGKCCKNNYTLVKHITTHEEPDPSKMLQCHVCSKLFNSKNKLNQHMVGHNNLRKWKCKICGMSFNFKKLLQMHTRAVHENERSFACTFCEKRFFKKYDLTVHVRLHTGDFPYACPVTDCDAKYPAWSNLFKHCQSRHKLDIRSEGYKKLRASEKAPQTDDYGSD